MSTRVLWVDGPRAIDVLRDWLETRGFQPMQPRTRPDGKPWMSGEHPEGYYVKSSGNAWTEAATMYRGGGMPKSRQKLTAVAELLDRLGVTYEAKHNSYHYPMLVVYVNDNLWRELPSEPVQPDVTA